MEIFIMEFFQGLWVILKRFNYGNFEKMEGNNIKFYLGGKK